MKKLRQHAAFKSISVIMLTLLVFFVVVSIIGYNSFTDALLSQYSEGAFLTAETAAGTVEGFVDRADKYLEMDTVQIEKHQKVLMELERKKRPEYLVNPKRILLQLEPEKRERCLQLLQIDESQLDELRIDYNMREYLESWSELDLLCNSAGATFIYIIRPDLSDYAHITFLASTINHESTYSRYEFGFVRETTNDEYREKYQALYEKKSDRELVIRDRGYIETDPHITAMISLKGKDGRVRAILCVQRQMDVLANARKGYIRKIIVALVIVLLLVVILQSSFLHRTLLQPLKLISDEATRFSRENVIPEKKLQDTIRNTDEIGQLAVSVDHMEEQITDYITSITQITAEKERMNTELTLATGIQADMLPHVFPPFPERKEFDLFAAMDPAKEVGGDFYDFFLVDDDHLGLVIADVSGKGIPAALFMMSSMILLQNTAMSGKSPAEILATVNSAICKGNQEQMFVTVWLGVLEISTGKLTAANAGHEYPALMRAGGSFELYKDKHGFVIGGMEGVRYKEYELRLNAGDKLFVYTDGVPEATDADQKLYGTDRMLAALNEAKDGTPEQLLQSVRRSVDGFVKDAEQFDDLTMLCMHYKGPDTAGGDGQ